MLSEVRAAVRRLAATPTFTGVAFLIIAFAIAANAAIFSLVDAVLLRRLPFENPNNLWQVWRVHDRGSVQFVRQDIVVEWQKLHDVFEVLEIQQFRAVTLTGAGEPRIVAAAVLGPRLMETLGVTPLLGRILQPADANPEHLAVAVIGHRLWQSQFGGDPGILGRQIRLDGESYEVVGVMLASFRFPRPAQQIWLPLRPTPTGPLRPVLQVFGRLRHGVSRDVAEQRLEAVVAAMPGVLAGAAGWRVRLRHPGDDASPAARTLVLTLAGSVALLLLIACANIAGLMLVRRPSPNGPGNSAFGSLLAPRRRDCSGWCCAKD